ncbi:MAG: alpha/beta hydrolase [Mucilaginibacter sp.]|nr:alpha/beta hydrolase [Mucilaginibacter sp.]
MENTSYSDRELLKQIPGFTSAVATVNGSTLHYVTGGEGEPLILIPGWPETWWSYHQVMSKLAMANQVIVVDIRGMGASGKPDSGYDKKNMAKDVFELIQTLGFAKVNICGHDIGAHVAFSFGANYPEATAKLIMLDTPHPDETLYRLPMLPIPGLNYTYPWWLAFNQVKDLPEALLQGRMKLVIDWIFNSLLNNPSAISEFDKEVYSYYYNTPESIRASNCWYQAFNQDIEDIKSYTKLKMPVLGIASNGSFDMLQSALDRYTENCVVKRIDDSGHFLLAEQPDLIVKYFNAFL